jgi:hypothetical protein
MGLLDNVGMYVANAARMGGPDAVGGAVEAVNSVATGVAQVGLGGVDDAIQTFTELAAKSASRQGQGAAAASATPFSQDFTNTQAYVADGGSVPNPNAFLDEATGRAGSLDHFSELGSMSAVNTTMKDLSFNINSEMEKVHETLKVLQTATTETKDANLANMQQNLKPMQDVLGKLVNEFNAAQLQIFRSIRA